MKKIPFRVLLLLVTCYMVQIFFGVNASMRGYLLPSIRNDFQISYTSGGLMFLIPVIPLILGSLSTGFLISHFNKRFLALFGVSTMALTLLAASFSPQYSIYLSFILMGGFGQMMIFIVTHMGITEFFTNYAQKFRSNAVILLHFFFGFGAIIAMFLSKIYLSDNPSWRLVYRLLFAFLFVLGVGLLFSKYSKKSPEANSIKPLDLLRMMTKPKMFFYGLTSIFYVGSEFAVINWCATYLEDGMGKAKSYSSFIMMLFFIVFTAGRLIAALLIHSVNQTATFILLCVGAAISAGFAFIFKIQLFGIDLFIPLIGFFVAAVYPILQNHVIHDFEDKVGIATGILVASSNIGATLMPFLIGIVNDWLGVEKGIVLSVIFLTLTLIFFIIAQAIHRTVGLTKA